MHINDLALDDAASATLQRVHCFSQWQQLATARFVSLLHSAIGEKFAGNTSSTAGLFMDPGNVPWNSARLRADSAQCKKRGSKQPNDNSSWTQTGGGPCRGLAGTDNPHLPGLRHFRSVPLSPCFPVASNREVESRAGQRKVTPPPGRCYDEYGMPAEKYSRLSGARTAKAEIAKLSFLAPVKLLYERKDTVG